MSTKSFDTTTSNHTINKSRSHLESRYPELRELDAKLKNISEKVIPASPYILTVPSNRPFNLSAHQADDLRRGTPFKAQEAQLQYLSFLADWDNGLITPVGGWDNEKGEIMEQASVARSTTTTPKVGAKKISMSDYKKRTTGQLGTNGHTKANSSTKPGDVSSAPSIKHSPNIQAGQKRSSDVLEKSTLVLEKSKKEDLEPSTKKARTLPTASSSSQAFQTKGSKLKLPPPISPTLPPAIEEELARLDLPLSLSASSKTKAAQSSSSSKHLNSHRSRESTLPAQNPSSRENNKSQASASSSRDLKRTGSSKHLPESHQSLKSSAKNDKTEAVENTRTMGLDLADHAPSVSTLPKLKHGEKLPARHELKQSKIVKLKIPRARRKDLARLLQMKPRPKAEVTKSVKQLEKGLILKSIEGAPPKSERERTRPPSENPTSGSESVENRRDAGRSSSGAQDILKAREKRPRHEDDAATSVPQSKRQKHPPSMDLYSKPSTPVPSAFKSPVLSHHGSAQKPRSSPNPEAKTVASRNDEAVNTPQGSVRNGTPAAPSSVERGNREVKSSSTTTLMSSGPYTPDDVASLYRDQRRYFELGKILKRESDALVNSSESKGSPQLEKKGLAISIETVLCFMLAYGIGDELMRAGQRNPSSAWTTIFPFISKVKFSARTHRHIFGLCLQLEAVCRMASWTLEYESAGSADYQHSLERHKALKKQYDEARHLFVKGSQELSVEDLQQLFPDTWAMNAQAPAAYSSHPKVTSSPLTDGFFLPITSTTVPIEAVRAGRSMIAEWCKNEGVDFKPRIGP